MFRWVDHTAELELEIDAASEEEAFAAGAAALAELLDGRPAGDVELRELALSAPERRLLFADWLAELAYLAERDGFVPERVARLSLAPSSLAAAVEGRRGTPPHLVKAVTYHRLEFGERDGRWRARAVLDV